MAPMSRSARERAAARDTPEATCSSIVRSRWYWNSSVSSCSTRSPRKSVRKRRRKLRVQRIADPPWSGRLDDEGNGSRQPLPLRGFGLQGSSPGCRQLVVLRSPIVFTGRPLGLNPALLLEFVEGGVQRALSHPELLVRHLTDALGDCPAVRRFERDDAKNQEIQRALHEIGGLRQCLSSP